MNRLFKIRMVEEPGETVVVDIMCLWDHTILTCIYMSIDEMFLKLPVKLKELRVRI